MILSHTLKLLRVALPVLALVCFGAGVARAQKIDKSKLDVAERRSAKAVKVLTDLAALPPAETIPKEIIERARGIAVFPDADKVNLLFQKLLKGSGLLSKRTTDGWTVPAFYAFLASDRGWTRIKSDSPGIIMLFMDDDILKDLEDGHIELKGNAGPVGELTPEQEKYIGKAAILVYSLSKGKLSGIGIEQDDTTQTGMNTDKNLNKSIYGMKARDLLQGKTLANTTALPPAIAEFQNALTALLPKP